jgi:hypothetical protein
VIALALAAYQLKNIPRDVEPAWVFGD